MDRAVLDQGVPTSPPLRGEGVETRPWANDDLRLLRVEEAAEYLAISRSRVYELLSDGTIPRVHIGRAVRITLGDLRQYVKTLLDEEQLSQPRLRLAEEA